MNKFNQLLESRWNSLKSGALGALLATGAWQGLHKMNEPTIPKATIEQPARKAISPERKHSDFIDIAMKFVKDNEGIIKSVRPDLCRKPGINVVGVGHKVLPGEKFGVMSPTAINQLLRSDVIKHIAISKRLFPEYEKYPDIVKAAILDGVFRGDMSGSPKAIALIKNNQWTEASKEYLRHKEYERSLAGENPGVSKRMERNAAIYAKYGQETGT